MSMQVCSIILQGIILVYGTVYYQSNAHGFSKEDLVESSADSNNQCFSSSTLGSAAPRVDVFLNQSVSDLS